MTGDDGPASVARWWRGALASGLEQHAEHPAIVGQPADVVGKTVPIFIHYDGAEFYQRGQGFILTPAVTLAPSATSVDKICRPRGDVSSRADVVGGASGDLRGVKMEPSRNQEFHIRSWGGILADRGSVFDRLFPVCAVADSSVCHMRSLHEAVANLLKWSSGALEQGRWPDVGMLNGEELRGWRGAHRRELLAEGWHGAFMPDVLRQPRNRRERE